MLEKDVELVHLLIEEAKAQDRQAAELRQKLAEAQAQLDRVKEDRARREGYVDVLHKAAELLDRKDLQVDLPDTTETEKQIVELEQQLAKLDENAEEYRWLINELEDKAPHLMQAITETCTAPESPAEHDLSPAGQLEEVSAGDEMASEEIQPEPVLSGPGAVADQGLESATDGEHGEPATIAPLELVAEEITDVEKAAILAKFKLDNIRERESSSHGHGAIYVIDSQSFLRYIERYAPEGDAGVAGVHENLVEDLDTLGHEISGTFHVVFEQPAEGRLAPTSQVAIDYCEAADDEIDPVISRINDLIQEYAGKLKTVCVVTGNPMLVGSLGDQGVHVIPLEDFCS